ncbi:DUF1206 domain-containing protein [Mycobacterium sp.]|uniref:DUF1206 domain-containing protein n=1 Tax=Mycobacterium sp. TaxID=1785 RepID=UPI0025E3D3C7|nr:DUF1206 domain-containing protein [Mycobacterium sp.]MBW0014093.1 DUF1206 domain-containing protein [Mycobacterium sp.]
MPAAISPTHVVRRATSERSARIAARTGYVISGVIHLLISYLVVRVALGHSSNADQSGALTTIADTTGGFASLWAVAGALVPLTLWRLAETVDGLHPAEHRRDPRDFRAVNRLKAFGLALVYAGVAVTAAQFALGRRKSSAAQNAGLSARLMHSTQGKAILIVAGIVIVAIGGYYAFKGASRKFLNDLTVSPGRALTALGVCGYVAEGIVLAGAGVLVVIASVRTDPSKATGLDGAVKVLQQAPFGTALIVLAASGFAAYGLYSFALSRYSRM